MKRLVALFIVFLFGCAQVNPRSSLSNSILQRLEESNIEAKTSSPQIAMENLKENIKKDFREIIGPSKPFDERVELIFSNSLYVAILKTPGAFDLIFKDWDETKRPKPTPEAIEKIIERNNVRIKALDQVVAHEIQLAEEKAKEDAERRSKIIAMIAGIALVTVAAAAGAAAGATAYRSAYDSTSFGPYIITRTGPNTTTVLTPSQRVYTCTTTGTSRVSVVNCF